jgi:hypothetical protein
LLYKVAPKRFIPDDWINDKRYPRGEFQKQLIALLRQGRSPHERRLGGRIASRLLLAASQAFKRCMGAIE